MGMVAEHETCVYGTDEPDDTIILGTPGLRDAGVIIDCRDRSWRSAYDITNIELVEVE